MAPGHGGGVERRCGVGRAHLSLSPRAADARAAQRVVPQLVRRLPRVERRQPRPYAVHPGLVQHLGAVRPKEDAFNQ